MPVFEAVGEALASPILQRALLGGTAVAVPAAVLGLFLVLRRYALFAEGMGHLAFGGIGLAAFLRWPPLETAFGVALLSALGIEVLRARRVGGDAAIAFFLTLGLGLGILFARLGGIPASRVEAALFGSLATLRSDDLWLIGGLSLGVLAVLSVLGHRLLAVLADEETARAEGLPVRGLNSLLVGLAALLVVAAGRITGVLLASALLVLPPLAALALARSFARAVGLSLLFALLTVYGGLFLAYFADWVPSGALVLMGSALVFLAHLGRRLRAVPAANNR